MKNITHGITSGDEVRSTCWSLAVGKDGTRTSVETDAIRNRRVLEDKSDRE